MRTDDIHCRESGGTGSVNLMVVPNECCPSQVTMDQIMCATRKERACFTVSESEQFVSRELSIHAIARCCSPTYL